MEFKTVIELGGKKLFTLDTTGESEIKWECYGSTTNKEHTTALIEIQRIGFLIGKLKTELDVRRMNDTDAPIVLG